MAGAKTNKLVVHKTKPLSYRARDCGELNPYKTPLFQMLDSLTHFSQGAHRAFAECQLHIQRWNAERFNLLKRKIYEAGLGWCTLCERILPTKICNGANYIVGNLALIRKCNDRKSSGDTLPKVSYELHTACKDCTKKYHTLVEHNKKRNSFELSIYDMVIIKGNIVHCHNVDELSRDIPLGLFSIVEMEECHITRAMEWRFNIPPSFEIFENHMAQFEMRAGKPSVAYFQLQVDGILFDLES